MKAKWTTYFLFALVLFIWGVIFYKIVFNFSSENKNYTIEPEKIASDLNSYDIIRQYVLHSKYRDPFLNEKSLNVEKPILTKNVTPIKVPVCIKTKIIWPMIIYRGTIYNRKTKSEHALISVNSPKIISTRINDTINEIVVKKIFKDSIYVEFKKEKKYITKTL